MNQSDIIPILKTPNMLVFFCHPTKHIPRVFSRKHSSFPSPTLFSRCRSHFFWSGERPAEFDSDLAVFFGRSWGGDIPTQGTICEKLAGYSVFLSWILEASVVRCTPPTTKHGPYFPGSHLSFPTVGSVNMLVPWRLKLQEIYLIYIYIYTMMFGITASSPSSTLATQREGFIWQSPINRWVSSVCIWN